MSTIMQHQPTTPISMQSTMPPAHMQQYNPHQHPQQQMQQQPHPSMNQQMPPTMNQQMNPAMNNPAMNQSQQRPPVNREQMMNAFRERLAVSGERQRLKEILKSRLAHSVDSPWRKAVEQQCQIVMQQNGLENTTFDLLVAQSQKTAREKVPSVVRQEMQEHIRRALSNLSRPQQPPSQQQQHHIQQPNVQQPNMSQPNMAQPNMQQHPHPHHGVQRMRDSM